jgi:hypothetical protein
MPGHKPPRFPQAPEPDKEGVPTAARRRDEAVKALGKAAPITADDVARHPGEPDYDRDAK